MTVDILRPGRDSLPACWADLSVSGVMLIVPLEARVLYHVGDEIDMAFALDGYEFRLRGTLVWVNDDERGKIQTAGVRFHHVGADIGEQHPELWAYFNRRVAPRVAPAPEEVIDVWLSSELGRVRARLADLSATGLRVAFGARGAESEAPDDGLGRMYELELRLAADLPFIHLSARAEHAQTEDGELRWGLAFLEEDDDSQSEAREVIEDYVRRRQRG
jgi:hypothetical protein